MTHHDATDTPDNAAPAQEGVATQPDASAAAGPTPEPHEAAVQASDTDADESSEADDAREAVDAVRALGPLFDRAVRSIRPLRIYHETRRADASAWVRHFKGRRPQRFNRPKMVRILNEEILERENIVMTQLFILLWNDTHRALYNAMRKHVETIDEDVEAIERIEDKDADRFVRDLLARGFDIDDIAICVYLNGVRFSPEFIERRLDPRTRGEGSTESPALDSGNESNETNASGAAAGGEHSPSE